MRVEAVFQLALIPRPFTVDPAAFLPGTTSRTRITSVEA
jgi:hypothetical protein